MGSNGNANNMLEYYQRWLLLESSEFWALGNLLLTSVSKGFAGNGLLDQTPSRFSREFLENRYHREIRDRPETPQNMGNLELGWTENPTLSSTVAQTSCASTRRRHGWNPELRCDKRDKDRARDSMVEQAFHKHSAEFRVS